MRGKQVSWLSSQRKQRTNRFDRLQAAAARRRRRPSLATASGIFYEAALKTASVGGCAFTLSNREARDEPDVFTYSVRMVCHRKGIRHGIISFLESGGPGVENLLCAVCK